MPSFAAAQLRDAYEHFSRVSDECAATGDYNPFADLFTEDCIYIEHVFGETASLEHRAHEREKRDCEQQFVGKNAAEDPAGNGLKKIQVKKAEMN